MFTTSYRHTEAALARAYSVPEKAMGAFRGRLGSLQKQGLFGRENQPGRGTALVYGPDQFHRMIFACELFEFGVAPATVLSLVETLWASRLVPIFRKAETAAMQVHGKGDIVLHMGGVRLMSDVWSDAVPNVNSCTLADLPKYVQVWMRGDGLPARALVVNLSERLRIFHEALADLRNAMKTK
jgi:hypothetical protein